MTEGLDMSLDDLIKNNKKSAGSDHHSGGRAYGHGRALDSGPGPGPTKRTHNRPTTRANPYFVPQAFHAQTMLVGGGSTSEAATKLYISNLDYEVTNEDVKVLFSDVGELKRYSVHYDRSGRSKGTAEVVYMRQSDALSAMKRYNNVQLDGKPMSIELVGVNIITPVPIPPMQKGILGNNPVNTFKSTRARVVGRGLEHGGSNGHRGSGKARGPPPKLSAEDLDADLEKYRLQAMHIN